jgi:hypothetical protein
MMPPPEATRRGSASYRSRPCAGSACTSTDWLLNHRSITAVTCASSAGRSGRPFAMPCHFARQPRQQVAVACCATNTGCPLKGVCLPSFAGFAAPSRLHTISYAWPRTASSPLLSRYRNCSARSRKRRRNGDFGSSWKIWSMSFVGASVRARSPPTRGLRSHPAGNPAPTEAGSSSTIARPAFPS